MMKKVLIIARAFPPFQPVGHSIRAVKFIKYLPTLDWQPVVLTIDDQKEYETTRKVGSEALLSEIHPSVQIFRTRAGEPSLDYLEKERKFSQRNRLAAWIAMFIGKIRRWTLRNLIIPDWYLTWLPYALHKGNQLVRKEKIDIIFVTCPPHSVSLIGALLKWLTKKPFILDFRDDWIDTPWYHSKPAVRQMIERWMEAWVVKTADKVILVTEWSKNTFLLRYPGLPGHKFVLIPNGCDLGEIVALGSTPPAKCNSRFTIVHAGSLNESISWGRSAAGLFQALHELIKQQPDMRGKLQLIFAGDFPDGHRKLVEKMGLTDVIAATGHLPHNEVLRLTNSADLLLAINYEGWSSLIPGKIYEYWAIGGPPILLLSCPGAAANFVKKHNLGFAVGPHDIEGIQQAILDVYSRSTTDVPLKIKMEGVEAFDRRLLTHQLARILSMES